MSTAENVALFMHRSVAGVGTRGEPGWAERELADRLVELGQASYIEDGEPEPKLNAQVVFNPLPDDDAPMAEWQDWAKPRMAELPRKKADLVAACHALAGANPGAE